jgi:hypothetical protein
LSTSEAKNVTVTATIVTGRITGEYQPGAIKFKNGVWRSDTYGCWADATTVVHATLTTLKPGNHVLACLLHVDGIAQVTDHQIANDPEATCSADLRKFA